MGKLYISFSVRRDPNCDLTIPTKILAPSRFQYLAPHDDLISWLKGNWRVLHVWVLGGGAATAGTHPRSQYNELRQQGTASWLALHSRVFSPNVCCSITMGVGGSSSPLSNSEVDNSPTQLDTTAQSSPTTRICDIHYGRRSMDGT